MARLSPATPLVLVAALLIGFAFAAVPASAQVNEPPVLVAPSEVQRDPGQSLFFNVTTSDPNGDAVTLEAANVPAGASFRLDGNGNGFFSWFPTDADTGFYTVTFIATDDGMPMLSTSGELEITIGDPNRPPELATIGDQEALVGQRLSFPLSATDPEGDALTLSNDPVLNSSALLDNGDGTGHFEYTPLATHVGNQVVTFVVTDARGGTDEETIVISVGEVNVPPILHLIGDRQGMLGMPLEITLMAQDADGDGLVLETDGLPDGLSLTDRGDGTGLIAGMPTAPGVHTVTVTVTDDGSPPEAAFETFEVDVQSPRDEPSALMLVARWSRRMLEVAGEGAVPGAEVEIRDATTDATLGHVLAGPDGSFAVTLRAFVPPCSVWGQAGEDVSEVVAVTGAPKGCSKVPPTRVFPALWSCHRGLYVMGYLAPVGGTVRVYDTGSGELLASTTGRRWGRFFARSDTDEFPESVTVSVEDGGIEWMLEPVQVHAKRRCHHRHHDHHRRHEKSRHWRR